MKDVKIVITEQDKMLVDNLIKLIARAEMKLQGVEVILASDSMKWLSRLQKQIELEIQKPKMEVVSQEPIKTETKTAKSRK